jgi:hypothetical protein
LVSGVPGNREWLDECARFIAHPTGQSVYLPSRDHNFVRETAPTARETNDTRNTTEIRPSLAARPAHPARQQRIYCHPITRCGPLDTLPDPDHLTRNLVSKNYRQVFSGQWMRPARRAYHRRPVPILAEITAADATPGHLDSYGTRHQRLFGNLF